MTNFSGDLQLPINLYNRPFNLRAVYYDSGQRGACRGQKNWDGVEALREKLKRSASASAMGNGLFPFTLANAVHNLPFLHACCVLDDALKGIQNSIGFTSTRNTFGGRIYGAEHKINWVKFSSIKKILKDRNDLAHDGKLLERKECWEHIDSIKAELLSWKIILP